MTRRSKLFEHPTDRPLPVTLRAGVGQTLLDHCDRLGLFASRLLELLIERHAANIDPDDAHTWLAEREPGSTTS